MSAVKQNTSDDAARRFNELVDEFYDRHVKLVLSAAAPIVELYDGERLRGASTISQQVAKNLFLWSGRSFVRKGLEAYFTVLLEVTWPKRRILEVYLNTAEFGDGIYGAATRSAIMQFEGSQGLPRTGYLTPSLVQSMKAAI